MWRNHLQPKYRPFGKHFWGNTWFVPYAALLCRNGERALPNLDQLGYNLGDAGLNYGITETIVHQNAVCKTNSRAECQACGEATACKLSGVWQLVKDEPTPISTFLLETSQGRHWGLDNVVFLLHWGWRRAHDSILFAMRFLAMVFRIVALGGSFPLGRRLTFRNASQTMYKTCILCRQLLQ